MDENDDFSNVHGNDELNLQSLEEKLRSSVWYTTAKICELEERKLNCKITRNFKQILGDIIYNQIQQMTKDSEAFAKHAKRSIVSPEDVKLCARRNDHLYDVLSEFAKGLDTEKAATATKKSSKKK